MSTCTYCGFEDAEESSSCSRCGSEMPDPVSREIQIDVVGCPSCGAQNHTSAEYCTTCGSPMAVITKVLTLSRSREREPLDTWRVYGIETSMVGREAEIAALEDAYASVLESGSFQSMRLTGSLGLGKSRLFAEFARRLDESFSSAYVLHAEARDETSGPYAVFARMLRRRFYIAEKEHSETAQRKLLEAVSAIMSDDGAERVAHLVGQLIDVPFDDSPFLPSVKDSEGASELDRRSYEALVELLVADSHRNPLVLIIEDLQYTNSNTLGLIDFVRKELKDAPVLMVLSWNPEEILASHPLEEAEYHHRLELTLLSDLEVEEFVRDTLRRAKTIPDDLIQRIVDSAHGNPLTVEEILRVLISQGIIDTRGRDWVIHERRLADVELPKTMEDAVDARLRALTREERTIMSMAACVGQVFWAELIHSLARVSDDEASAASGHWADETAVEHVDKVIESLERKDMVRRQADSILPGCHQLYFKHRIEPRKVYETLPAREKQTFHRVIAQWLAQHFQEKERSESIARHFDKAHCLDQAARYYLVAASDARASYDNPRAMELYLKGLSYLSDADIQTKLTAFHDVGTVFDIMGEYDQALGYYREMLRYSWLLNDQSKGGVAYNKIGRAYRSLGEYDRALSEFERSLTLFRSIDDVRGIASTLDDIGKIHWYRGAFEEAETFFTAGLHLRRQGSNSRSIALSLTNLGSVKLQRGDQKQAMVYLREALDLRKKVDDKQGVVHSFNNLGILLLERGDVDEALTLMQEALDLAREIGYRGSEAFVLNNLGEIYLRKSDYSEARTHLDLAMCVAEDSGERRALFDVLRNLGHLEMKEMNRDLALLRMNEALEIANQLNSNVLIGVGMQSLADVHASYIFDVDLRAESEVLAEACYDDAVSILKDVGNETELGRCLSSYGKFLVERGDSNLGRERLMAASDIFEKHELQHLYDSTQEILESI